MTTPAGLERKVRQLDSDVQAIYDMLNGIMSTQQRQGNRLNEIDTKLDEMGSKLGEMGGKLDTIIGLLGERR
jgi:hypothetical protein